jgi:hypothetical protein
MSKIVTHTPRIIDCNLKKEFYGAIWKLKLLLTYCNKATAFVAVPPGDFSYVLSQYTSIYIH